MDEKEYRQRISEWAYAERFAEIAESMVRDTYRAYLVDKAAPPSEEIQRIARERRATAERLFQELYGAVKHRESNGPDRRTETN